MKRRQTYKHSQKQCGQKAAAGRARAGRGGRNFSGPWRKTPGRLLGAGLIRLYQLTLSGFIGNQCRYLPTCSEYGYEAIARFGLWKGGFMTLFRLMRCGPFGARGFDPVPPALPARCRAFAPWRLWRIPAASSGGKAARKQRNSADKR